MSLRILLSALFTGLLLGGPAGAELREPGETPLADVLQLLVLERDVVAVDGLAGTELRERLELGEVVLSAGYWRSRSARAPGRRRATGAVRRRRRVSSSASRWPSS